jgi:hypothetical protein
MRYQLFIGALLRSNKLKGGHMRIRLSLILCCDFLPAWVCAHTDGSSSYSEINKDGRTPLHLAAINGSSLEQLLREKGVRIDAVDVWGRTPLHYAALNWFIEISTFFLKLEREWTSK